jgi:hypothetical protein
LKVLCLAHLSLCIALESVLALKWVHPTLISWRSLSLKEWQFLMLCTVIPSWYSHVWSSSYHFLYGGQNSFYEIRVICPILTNLSIIFFKGKERNGKVFLLCCVCPCSCLLFWSRASWFWGNWENINARNWTRGVLFCFLDFHLLLYSFLGWFWLDPSWWI